MNQENAPQRRRSLLHAGDPSEKLSAVGVRTVTVQNLDARAQRDFVTKHTNPGTFLNDASAERVLGLEAYYKNGVSRIVCTMNEVVDNSSRFCHPRRGNDNEWRPQGVERL
jgi:hypothetical protein